MASDRDAGVDPRFDPVFQRGYDPAVHRGRRPRGEERAVTTTPVQRVEPMYRVPASRAAESAPGPEPTPHDPRAIPDGAAVGPAAEIEPRGRNPFRLALLVASLAAIVGSALLLWYQLDQDPYANGYSGDAGDIFQAQFLSLATAPLLTAGLIGLTLWLALGVLIRRRGPDA